MRRPFAALRTAQGEHPQFPQRIGVELAPEGDLLILAAGRILVAGSNAFGGVVRRDGRAVMPEPRACHRPPVTGRYIEFLTSRVQFRANTRECYGKSRFADPGAMHEDYGRQIYPHPCTPLVSAAAARVQITRPQHAGE